MLAGTTALEVPKVAKDLPCHKSLQHFIYVLLLPAILGLSKRP